MAEKAGRPKRLEEVTALLLRIPTALLARVDHCQWLLQRQEGPKISRTAALERAIEAGCEALEGSLEGSEAPVPAPNLISTLSNGSPPAYDDMLACLGEEDEEETLALPGDVPQAAETPPTASEPRRAQTPTRKTPAQHGLPRAKLQEIADERTRCEGLSLQEFAQRLHDRGIYSARAKDGSHVPANPGNVKKWLEQARAAGVL